MWLLAIIAEWQSNASNKQQYMFRNKVYRFYYNVIYKQLAKKR